MLDKRKALIIDYDTSYTNTLKNYLVENDFKVVIEPDSLEAVTTAHVEDPVVILVAIDMPGVMGYQLVRIFKEAEELADIPIIMVGTSTQDNGSELLTRAMNEGADESIMRHEKFSSVMKKLNKVTGYIEEEDNPVSLLLF